jgi:hypothetical protein
VNISGVPASTKVVGEEVWKQTLEDFSDGRSIPLNSLLMLDARYFKAIGDIRQATLNAAAGLENLKEATAERLWAVRNPGQAYTRSQRDKLFKGASAPFIPAFSLPRHVDESFQAAFGRSYRLEHPAEWQGVNNLWNARNSVAHGDLPEFGSPPVEVTSHILSDMLRAAEHCAAWLSSL